MVLAARAAGGASRPSWTRRSGVGTRNSLGTDEEMVAHRKRAKGLTVVFTTYQSLPVVDAAQKQGVVCQSLSARFCLARSSRRWRVR